MDLLDHPLFEFGRPPNLAAWGALVLGLFFVLLPRQRARLEALAARAPSLSLAVSLAAAALSTAYFAWVLGGSPRIIDATAYLCSARIFATGSFTFQAPEPSALFRGRFLIHPPGAPAELGVIFPPGYPAFLSFFERFLDYRVAGPLLAFAITLGTYFLAFFLASSRHDPSKERPRVVGLLAASLSLMSATLRYHTADTMSHGLSTLLVLAGATVVARAWAIARLSQSAATILGFALGMLVATRPLTGLAAALVLLFAARRLLQRPHLVAIALGAFPGALLLLLHQRALTGELWDSVQLRYYALADGPASCFGLGFGKGCEFEHGDVVRERGKLGPLWAILNSLHRLHNHALDLANCELLFVFLVAGLLRTRKEQSSRFGLVALAVFVSVYSLFYFDGSYPGGGARFLVELLPLEHALLAGFALDRLGFCRTLGISCLGFALHGSYSHEALRTRDGGAPFLDPAVVQGTDPRVVFVESDHAFLLGLRPEVLGRGSAARNLEGTLVARRSHDERETALISGLGDPPAFLLEKEPPGSVLIPWSPVGGPRAPLLLEAERDYPPLSTNGLWVHPAHLSAPCVSAGRALRIHLQPGTERGSLDFWFDGVDRGRYQARPVFWSEKRGCFSEGDVMLSAPGPLSLMVPRSSGADLLFLDRIELTRVESGAAAQHR